MKRTTPIQTNDDTLLNRKKLAQVLGYSYGGDRNLYTALGYPTQILFEDYFARYVRQDIANAIIEKPIKYTWKGGTTIHNPEAKDDILKNAWDALKKRLKLDLRFRTADRLSAIFEFSILLLGFDDVKVDADFTNPVEGTTRKLLYVTAYSQASMAIQTYDLNPSSERYGLPLIYQVSVGTEDGNQSTILVHYTRVLHVAGEVLTSDIKGVPALESVWNRLMDIEKISGGSAEMFWRGARPGYDAAVKDDYDADNVGTELNAQFKTYENELTRILVTEGIVLKSLAPQIEDPTAHLNIQIDLIAAAKNIPKRMLVGSERGELSSSQDADSWADIIDGRREEIAEPQILEPFVDMCMKYGILPKSNYDIEWTSLHMTSDKDKAEIGRIRATALQAYTANPQTQETMPPEAFYKFLMGLETEEIEEILAMIEADAFDTMEEIEIEPIIPETE